MIKVEQSLLIIDSLETNYNALEIDAKNIKVRKICTDLLELIPYSDKGKKGVIIADLINKTPLLRLEAILYYYVVAVPNRMLKVLLNNTLVDPELFLADVKK